MRNLIGLVAFVSLQIVRMFSDGMLVFRVWCGKSAPFLPLLPMAMYHAQWSANGSCIPRCREGCLCVICKQMRRAAREARPEAEGSPVYALRSTARPAPAANATVYRVGKRAYISATPHLVRGGRASLQVQLHAHSTIQSLASSTSAGGRVAQSCCTPAIPAKCWAGVYPRTAAACC